jgi:hypothetical protein
MEQRSKTLTDADCSTNRGLECGSCRESNIQSILVAFPLLIGKESAPVGETKTDSFVCAERLCVVLYMLDKFQCMIEEWLTCITYGPVEIA